MFTAVNILICFVEIGLPTILKCILLLFPEIQTANSRPFVENNDHRRIINLARCYSLTKSLEPKNMKLRINKTPFTQPVDRNLVKCNLAKRLP